LPQKLIWNFYVAQRNLPPFRENSFGRCSRQGPDVTKNARKLLHRFVRLPLDPSVAHVSRRFLVRFAILLVFSALPIAGGFKGMFVLLTGVNAIMCAVWALLRRERPNGAGLTHWDEALAMSGMWLVAQLA